MRIVFFGTSPFAARILTYLIEQNVELVAVITKPDKPKGRSLQMLPPAVKETAQRLRPDLPLYQPPRASTPEFAQLLKTLSPDLFVVVAYGEIIKTNLLEIPYSGCINIHASLLPKYRGAAPIQRCLMNGDTETGVTIMDMVLEMDAGDMLEVAKIPVPETMNFGELDHRLSEIACPALSKVLEAIKSGTLKKRPQNSAEVTFAPKITPQEEEIDWTQSARHIHNQIRALSPSPGAWCYVLVGGQKKRLKIKKSLPVSGATGTPGQFIQFDSKEWIIACGTEALKILEVQLEGKKNLSSPEFIRGLNTSLNLSISN